MPTPTDTDWAYLAGIFDGEGSVSIRATQGSAKRREGVVYHCLQVSISNTDFALLSWVTEIVGAGHVNRTGQMPGRKQVFQWVAVGATGAAFLRKVMPHLRVKRGQALLGLELQSLIGQGAVTDELMARRSAVREQVMELNRRGA